MLGERLVKLRKSKQIGQDEVAKNIGVARTTYAMYEQNRRQPDYETLKQLANFYGVTTDYLLDFKLESGHKIDVKELLESGEFTYSGVELTEEQRKSSIAFFEAILHVDKID